MLVNDYLSPNAASLRGRIDSALKQDETATNKATGVVPSVHPEPSGGAPTVQATVSWVYNPYTRFVVAYLATSQAPDKLFVISYKVGGDGNIVGQAGSVVPAAFGR